MAVIHFPLSLSLSLSLSKTRPEVVALINKYRKAANEEMARKAEYVKRQTIEIPFVCWSNPLLNAVLC